MTLDKEYQLLKLDLQYFSEDGDGGDEFTDSDAELAATIRGLLDSEQGDDNQDDYDDDFEEVTLPEDDDDTDDPELDDADLDEELDEDPEEQSTDKKVQSKEENARFAQERRERQAREAAERELERLKQEAPEFKLAKMLSDQYGQPVEQIMEQIKEAQLQKEAQEAKIPVDVLRKQRQQEEETNGLRDEIAMLKYQNWQTQIKADGSKLMTQYTMLTQEDMDKATDYILNVARNVDMPLEDAVYAVHGKKIVESMAKNKVQDELAAQSGRKKKTPLAPNNGKPSKVVSLTAAEREAARAFGMTDEEYIKFK